MGQPPWVCAATARVWRRAPPTWCGSRAATWPTERAHKRAQEAHLEKNVGPPGLPGGLVTQLLPWWRPCLLVLCRLCPAARWGYAAAPRRCRVRCVHCTLPRAALSLLPRALFPPLLCATPRQWGALWRCIACGARSVNNSSMHLLWAYALTRACQGCSPPHAQVFAFRARARVHGRPGRPAAGQRGAGQGVLRPPQSADIAALRSSGATPPPLRT